MHMVNYRPGNTGRDFSVFTGGGQNRRRGLLLGWAASPNEMASLRAQLESRIGYMLARPVGRPANEVRPSRSNFSYQVGIWTKPRRVIAKVGWRPRRTLSPRRVHRDESVSPERVVAFYKTRRARCGSSSKRPRPTPFGEPAMLLAIDIPFELLSNPENHYNYHWEDPGNPGSSDVFLFRPCGVGCYCDKPNRPLKELL